MADKAVSELIAAQKVNPTDLFVLEQDGTAKKLTGQVLENWLLSFAGGHGGIHSIEKHGSTGLADTYRITLADETHYDIVLTNGRGISTVAKTKTSGLVDTYTITYNDGTTGTFMVTNGERGETGQAWYVHIKYASQQPTDDSHSMGDVPDAWIGVYSGTLIAAPDDWKMYQWYRIRGDRGLTGEPATVVYTNVEYQAGTSGTVIPSGTWLSGIPYVPQGSYLWSRTTLRFNTGGSIISYSVGRMGLDGRGSVVSVCGISPGENGDVELTAEDVNALPDTGGTMKGTLNMDGQKLTGLNNPAVPSEAANKGYVDAARFARNLLDNSDFTNPINQRGVSGVISEPGYFLDRWKLLGGSVTVHSGGITLNGTMIQYLEAAPEVATPTCDGGASASYDAGENAVTIVGSGAEITWAALYEGEYTTEALPHYVPKGRSVELEECRRYYQRWGVSSQTGAIATGYAYSDTSVRVVGYISPMRIKPTVSIVTSSEYIPAVICGGKTLVRGNFEADYSIKPESSMAFITIPVTGATAYELAVLTCSSGAYFELNADL